MADPTLTDINRFDQKNGFNSSTVVDIAAAGHAPLHVQHPFPIPANAGTAAAAAGWRATDEEYQFAVACNAALAAVSTLLFQGGPVPYLSPKRSARAQGAFPSLQIIRSPLYSLKAKTYKLGLLASQAEQLAAEKKRAVKRKAASRKAAGEKRDSRKKRKKAGKQSPAHARAAAASPAPVAAVVRVRGSPVISEL